MNPFKLFDDENEENHIINLHGGHKIFINKELLENGSIAISRIEEWIPPSLEELGSPIVEANTVASAPPMGAHIYIKPPKLR